jgi:hypothetical protein
MTDILGSNTRALQKTVQRLGLSHSSIGTASMIVNERQGNAAGEIVRRVSLGDDDRDERSVKLPGGPGASGHAAAIHEATMALLATPSQEGVATRELVTA